MTKAELLGCEYETGMCEHYIPGDGKVINGVMRYPGIGNVPMGHGRCLQVDKMISRIVACPISGKSAKKLTKVERFGCLKPQCEHYNKGESVPWCKLAGQYAAINALRECPKTQSQEVLQEESAPSVPVPPMRILALDVATGVTGWALREGDRITEHGTIKAPKGDIEERKDYIRQKLLHYCLNGQPLNIVMIERSFVFNSGNTTRLLCELQGIIKNCCHRMGYPIVEPSPTTWRAICPGSGKCDKDAAVEYARLKGYVFETADEAEAICMALSFSAGLVKILDAEKEKKKNGKSKSKEGNGNGNNGSNGGKRGGVAAGIAVSACATKAS